MPPTPSSSPVARWLAKPGILTLWCLVAAFGSYACMYGFRKPFTAATFSGTPWGDSLKVWLVTAQVIGYCLSKFIGIKIVAEMPAARRARFLLGLILASLVALVGFALTPAPYNAFWMFCNGLPLGMVFGLVLGFLEGRKMTEFFVAGLCTSFILADGVAKTIGKWLLGSGVSDYWMPAAAGGVFLLPLFVFVWMLQQIPPPSAEDVAERSQRTPMTGKERIAMLKRHGFGLAAILLVYLLITVLRSIRADFAPEIWDDLGFGASPDVFTHSEFWVGIGVMVANGSIVLFRNNLRAFFVSLWMCAGGLALALAAVVAWKSAAIPPFAFMVLLGIGMYIPYVAVHTTVFERLIAITREKGNIGFLMTLADAVGYLGYCGVMIFRSRLPKETHFLPFFTRISNELLVSSLLLVLIAIAIYYKRSHHLQSGTNASIPPETPRN